MTEFFFQQENEDLVKKINEEKEKANTEFKRLETQIHEVSGKFFQLWGYRVEPYIVCLWTCNSVRLYWSKKKVYVLKICHWILLVKSLH